MAIRREEKGRGKKSSLELVFGKLMIAYSLTQKEHWKCLHINCLLRFPFFETNECFRFKHNCSLLITVLVTLLFFLLISTCDSRR